jgi:hypothetical protein
MHRASHPARWQERRATVASALIRFPDLLAQLVFTPLLAGWSIWIGWRFVSATFDRERLITGTR